MPDDPNHANVRFPPPLIYLAPLVLGIVIGRALHVPEFDIQPKLRSIIGLIVIVLGATLTLSGAGLFLRNRTAIIPHKSASRLVTKGIYQWTRNPMYLGITFLYCGFAILFGSLLALLLLPIVLLVIQLHVIAREEAYLDRRFGEEYRAYKARVRRWL